MSQETVSPQAHAKKKLSGKCAMRGKFKNLLGAVVGSSLPAADYFLQERKVSYYVIGFKV
jgi:hypothetical protein